MLTTIGSRHAPLNYKDMVMINNDHIIKDMKISINHFSLRKIQVGILSKNSPKDQGLTRALQLKLRNNKLEDLDRIILIEDKTCR